MDTLFLGIFNAVPRCILRIHGRKSTRHMIEHRREKQFMSSLVRDLKKDTAFLNFAFPRKEARLHAIDSVFTFFENKPLPNEVPGYVIVQIRRTAWDQPLDRNNSTIEQLKNSGNLPLIKKQKVADSLAEYDLLWQRAQLYRDMYFIRVDENNSYQQKIFSGTDLLPFYSRDSKDTVPDYRKAASIKIHSAYLDEYFNYLNRQIGPTRNDIRVYKSIYDSAIRLINLVNKEYQLE